MNKISICLLGLLLATVSQLSLGFDNQTGWPSGSSPDFCHGDDCPVFNVTSTANHDQVEIRDYAPGLWTSVNVTGVEFLQTATKGFFQLFDYISGDNVEKMNINMTAPVAIKIFPGEGPFCNTTFVVSFFVPFDYQDSSNPPPRPTNPNVYTHWVPARRLAVIQFGGFVKSFDTVIPKYNALAQWLDEQGYSYTPNLYTVSEYDSPYVIVNRHNEVWIELPTQ